LRKFCGHRAEPNEIFDRQQLHREAADGE
jgi:hypothetical protein